MASVPSPSSPPASPSSASSSDNSATEPISHSPPNPQVDAGVNNGVLNVDEKKPDISAYFDDLHSANHIEKFKKYEADYSRWLTAKYFSKKNLYGGNIFDEDMTIQDEIIKSSRWPCTRSYADPVQGFEEQSNSCSTTTIAETPSNISNGKHLAKKNS
ncbi:uncharacterized protein Pyn_23427 [Prunus yedoensis var. nudiflora]|uniref:Uncharacterized protein n=2 Tax=Prunus TaxID=3754 RepID=A0A314UNW1_PRUYE|nr:uncharacterized protein LOC18776517 [Prunus persica]ONI08998.1 hypothetical protein PRUPE_5G211300 [Prunus persica]PQM39051.1 uncharacterized protein Pyn_23427 [Prunus yedoensis var. nudiflora]